MLYSNFYVMNITYGCGNDYILRKICRLFILGMLTCFNISIPFASIFISCVDKILFLCIK